MTPLVRVVSRNTFSEVESVIRNALSVACCLDLPSWVQRFIQWLRRISRRQLNPTQRSVISARSDQSCSASVRDATNPRQSRRILC